MHDANASKATNHVSGFRSIVKEELKTNGLEEDVC